MYGAGGHVDRCTFFMKMGACRHGDGCTKHHIKPTSSKTVLFPMLYPNPLAIERLKDRQWNFTYDRKYLKKHFEKFYKDMFRTFMEFGRIAELRVCGNLCDHLLGNVYIKFESPEVASEVVNKLHTKKLYELLLLPELSPVMDFADACCKEDLEGACGRGLHCNFLHILKVSKSLMEKLEKEQKKFWKKRDKESGVPPTTSSAPTTTTSGASAYVSSAPPYAAQLPPSTSGGGGGGGRRDRSRTRSRSRREKRQRTPPRRRTPEDNRVCHICGNAGHISRDCPSK